MYSCSPFALDGFGPLLIEGIEPIHVQRESDNHYLQSSYCPGSTVTCIGGRLDPFISSRSVGSGIPMSIRNTWIVILLGQIKHFLYM